MLTTARRITLGFLVAVGVSCSAPPTPPCDAQTCATGCCDSVGTCRAGNAFTSCGSGGAACRVCESNQACTAGACTGGSGGDAGADAGVDAGSGDAGQDAGLDAGPDAGRDGGFDGGGSDAGCIRDDDCAPQLNGTRCNLQNNTCIPAIGCNVSGDCQSLDPTSYCYQFGAQCRCVPEAGAPAGNIGVCRRRLAPCEPCTTDAQCGSEPVFDPMGTCKALPGSTAKFCFQQKVGACLCGMVDDGFGFCKPQSNSCASASAGCFEDKHCPASSVCNTAACLCQERCRWDFAKKALASPGCPPGRTCWVDSQNLDAGSHNYGAGRCRAACVGDAECLASVVNHFGGPNLACRAEQLSGGGFSDKRCRANGACMDDLECPQQPATSSSLGFCDRGSFQCRTDCRVGTDPVTGSAFSDCRAPFMCTSDGGTNSCTLASCVAQGGAAIACVRGAYCCGEDKNNDGVSDPCPPPSSRGPDECYTAPKPPFCSTCSTNADCANLPQPAYLSGAGACANGSKSPSCSSLPMICVSVGPRPGTTAPDIKICAPSTFNDGTKNVFGVGRDQQGCPTGYPVTLIRPQVIPVGPDFCNVNADCNLGTDAGRCAVELAVFLPDGGHPKTCQCTAGSANQCPNDGAGISSVCKYGIAGQTVPCVQSLVCLPTGSLLFSDAGAPLFGCGL